MSLPAGFGPGLLSESPSVSDLIGRTVAVTESLPPSVLQPGGGGGTGGGTQPPATHGTKGAAAPGDVFAAEATVAAQNAVNAAKLAGLGFVAAPATAWTTGQKITILPTFHFYWDGAQWVDGAVPAAPPPPPEPEPEPDGPGDTWTKGEICDWLDAHGIYNTKAMTKQELLGLVP